MPILIAAVALLGLAVGSFLNVVIHRVPRQESLVSPGSHCPQCDHAVRTRHNVPVFGWLLLRGRCADCDAPISARYPIVEAATAVLFVAVTVQVAHLGLLAALPAYLFFTAVGVALTAIDLDTMRLPNAIVFPSYVVLAALLTLASLLHDGPTPLLRAFIGAAALFTFFLALALVYPTGMGFGDVKLAGVVGAALGFLSYPAVIVGAFAAFAMGACVGICMLVTRRARRTTALPFGPFLVAGALLALFASAPIADFYTGLVQRA
jgi:leader peptidase (prepilin peptidase) / N-methyltransferase